MNEKELSVEYTIQLIDTTNFCIKENNVQFYFPKFTCMIVEVGWETVPLASDSEEKKQKCDDFESMKPTNN